MALSMAIVLTYFEPPCFGSQSYTATNICAWFQNHLSTNRLRSQVSPFVISDFSIFLDHLKLALAAGETLRSFVKEKCSLSVQFINCQSLDSVIRGRFKNGFQLQFTPAFLLVFDKSAASFQSLITELENVLAPSSLPIKPSNTTLSKSVNIVSGSGKTLGMTPAVREAAPIVLLREQLADTEEQLVAKEAECNHLHQQLDLARAEIDGLKKTALRRRKEDISTALIRLIDEASVFSAINPASGKEVLTNHTGVFTNNLNTHCSLSFEKMPMAAVNFFSMYFGELTINLFNKISRVSLLHV